MNFPVHEDEAMSISSDDNVYYYDTIIENSSRLDAFTTSISSGAQVINGMLPLGQFARPSLLNPKP